MGTFGVGLYDDDTAADLKSSLSILCTIPVTGDRLLDILLRQYDGDVALSDEAGPTFWLVVADQFERRGIHCQTAFERALAAITSGVDLDNLRARGMGARELAKRATLLQEIAIRLQSPRAERKLPKTPKPPECVVQAGEVYAFPTWSGRAVNAWVLDKPSVDIPPDGWGALLILECGRVFDWLPWCAVASLTVDPARPVDMNAVLQSKLLLHLQTKGAALCVPKKSHVQRMQMLRMGELRLDSQRAHEATSKTVSAEAATNMGWSISAAAYGANFGEKLPQGATVASLLATV